MNAIETVIGKKKTKDEFIYPFFGFKSYMKFVRGTDRIVVVSEGTPVILREVSLKNKDFDMNFDDFVIIAKRYFRDLIKNNKQN